MAKSKKEKGEEILRKRELARKGFAPKVDEDADPLDQEEREKGREGRTGDRLGTEAVRLTYSPSFSS